MTRETFSDLVMESERTLFCVAMSMLKNETDCEDAVQTAILTAYEKLDSLKNEAFFKTWLVRILINVCKQQLRSRRRVVSFEEYSQAEEAAPADNIDVRMAVEQLPLPVREVIVLYYMEEFTVKEIRSILHIPEGTIKSRLSKGRELLRLSLQEN